MSREAMQMALDALTSHQDLIGTNLLRIDAISALRAALAEQPAPQVLTDAEIDAAFSRAVGSSLPIHVAAVRAILARAIPPGHVVVPAAEIEALRKERDEMDILATYSRNDGRREWVNVGTWLHHGEVVVHMAARPGGQHEVPKL